MKLTVGKEPRAYTKWCVFREVCQWSTERTAVLCVWTNSGRCSLEEYQSALFSSSCLVLTLGGSPPPGIASLHPHTFAERSSTFISYLQVHGNNFNLYCSFRKLDISSLQQDFTSLRDLQVLLDLPLESPTTKPDIHIFYYWTPWAG